MFFKLFCEYLPFVSFCLNGIQGDKLTPHIAHWNEVDNNSSGLHGCNQCTWSWMKPAICSRCLVHPALAKDLEMPLDIDLNLLTLQANFIALWSWNHPPSLPCRDLGLKPLFSTVMFQCSWVLRCTSALRQSFTETHSAQRTNRGTNLLAPGRWKSLTPTYPTSNWVHCQPSARLWTGCTPKSPGNCNTSRLTSAELLKISWVLTPCFLGYTEILSFNCSSTRVSTENWRLKRNSTCNKSRLIGRVPFSRTASRRRSLRPWLEIGRNQPFWPTRIAQRVNGTHGLRIRISQEKERKTEKRAKPKVFPNPTNAHVHCQRRKCTLSLTRWWQCWLCGTWWSRKTDPCTPWDSPWDVPFFFVSPARVQGNTYWRCAQDCPQIQSNSFYLIKHFGDRPFPLMSVAVAATSYSWSPFNPNTQKIFVAQMRQKVWHASFELIFCSNLGLDQADKFVRGCVQLIVAYCTVRDLARMHECVCINTCKNFPRCETIDCGLWFGDKHRFIVVVWKILIGVCAWDQSVSSTFELLLTIKHTDRTLLRSLLSTCRRTNDCTILRQKAANFSLYCVQSFVKPTVSKQITISSTHVIERENEVPVLACTRLRSSDLGTILTTTLIQTFTEKNIFDNVLCVVVPRTHWDHKVEICSVIWIRWGWLCAEAPEKRPTEISLLCCVLRVHFASEPNGSACRSSPLPATVLRMLRSSMYEYHNLSLVC